MFCPQCATPLDPAARFCSKCGSTAGVIGVAQETSPPSSVQIAVWTLIGSIVLGLGLTLFGYGRIGFSRTLRYAPASILITVVFVAAWVAVVLFLTQRQGWVRFFAAILLLWGIGTLISGFSRVHFHGMFQGTMLLTWTIAIGRMVAIALLFTPESETWFRGRQSESVRGSLNSV